MIYRNRMTFMAPEGDAGGGAAVADPPAPAADPAMTPVGELYEAEMARLHGEEPAPAPAPKPAEPAKEPDKTPSPEPSAPDKPASALDAAIDAAPAEPKEGETAPKDDFLKDLPENLPREGRGEHWQRARGAIEKQGQTISQLHQTVADLTKQVETAKTTPSVSAEREAALQKQLDDYKDAIVGLNVEYDPEHRKKFVDGRANLVAKASSKLNAFGGKGELISEALSMPEGRSRSMAIKEALGDLDDVDRNRVLQFVAEVEKLDDERAEIMKDPQGAWDRLQKTQNDARQLAAQKAEEFKKSVFESVAKKLPNTLFLLRKVDSALPGAETHNANAKAMREGAFKLLGNDAKPEELVEAAFWKQAGPKLQELFVGSRKELATALAALKEYEGAEPGFRGGKGPAKTEKEAQLAKSPEQIYNETMAGLAGGE